MIIKYFDDKIEDINPGMPHCVYFLGFPNIKEFFIEGQWIPNPAYDLSKIKSQKLSEIESKILDASMKLDKANSLNLQTQVSELTAKLTELNKQKGEINAF